MKFYKLLFLGLVILVSCKKQDTLIFNEGPVVITGQIENAKDKTILLTILELTGRVEHIAKIDSSGHFRFSVNVLSSHDNFLNYGGDLVTIYLEPNDSIYLVADGSKFEKTIKYSGDNAKFNQCLQIFFIKFINSLESEKFLQNKNDLAPNEFKEFTSDFFNRMNSKVDSIGQVIQPEENAIAWMKSYLKYRRAEDLLEYGMHYKKDLPSDYYNFELDFLQQGKYDIQCSQYYEDFIDKYYFGYKLSKVDGFNTIVGQFQEQTYAGLDALFDFVDKNVSNKIVKSIFLTKICNDFVAFDYKTVDSIFYKYSQIVDDITCQNFILQRIDDKKSEPALIETIDDLAKLEYIGEIFNGIKLDYKGKVLYIDMWGTWCGGCLGAFPSSNKLHEALKNENIEFVYLCIKSTKSDWEKTIKEYNLKGRHFLLTDDQTAILSEKFNSYGVPRYIIIDKNGTIVNTNAKNPYSSELKDELLTLINL